MKKFLACMLVLLMAFAVGCITGSDSKDKDSDTDTGGSGSGSSAKAAEYLPLQVGATWKWETTDDQGYSYGSTETITGTTSLGGKDYYVISDDYGGNTYIRLANNIAYMYLEEEWAAKAHARGATFEATDVPMFDFSKSAGKTWSIYSASQSEQGYSFTIKMTGKYVGLKSVTVPAGTFSNCAVFEITADMQFKSTYIYETITGSYTAVATHYFAKGVGPVKVATKGTDITNGEKTESTETQECTYYSIPGGASGGDSNSGGNGGGTTYSVTGEVKDSSGKGISGVLMELSGSGAVYTLTTDSQGRYTFEDVSNGTYTITPTKSGYTFTPSTRQASVSGSNLTVSAFAGAVSGGGNGGGTTTGTGIGTGSYTVSGRVVDSSGKGIAGIKVTIFDEYKEASTTTDSNGYYTFRNIATGSYGLYCDETDNYEFSPWIGYVAVEGKDATAEENFVGTPPKD